MRLHWIVAKHGRKYGDKMKNAVIRARIDEKIKEDATAVLAANGMTVSEAVRELMITIATDKIVPFGPITPNAETIQAIEDARNGKMESFNSVEELMADLNAND